MAEVNEAFKLVFLIYQCFEALKLPKLAEEWKFIDFENSFENLESASNGC